MAQNTTHFKISLASYDFNEGYTLPILFGGTYDANGYFTKST